MDEVEDEGLGSVAVALGADWIGRSADLMLESMDSYSPWSRTFVLLE